MLSNPTLLYLVYKLFCHNVFQILIYFLFENASPMKKIIYSFATTPSKSWDSLKLRLCNGACILCFHLFCLLL